MRTTKCVNGQNLDFSNYPAVKTIMNTLQITLLLISNNMNTNYEIPNHLHEIEKSVEVF